MTSESSPVALNAELQRLANEFFTWRQKQQPVSGDDIPRVERPESWLPSFSKEDLAIYRVRYREYLERLEEMDKSDFSKTDEVDAQILAAAIKRVGWELDVLRLPHKNPWFYLDQTLGSVFELLILSSPMDEFRIREMSRRFQYFPVTIEHAKTNLTETVQPFAIITIESLLDIEQRLSLVLTGLLAHANEADGLELTAAIQTASVALSDYRLWLQRGLSEMTTDFSIGKRAYQWFLLNVALLPYKPEELLLMGQQAWNRSVTLDALERNHNQNLPELPVFKSIDAQIATAAGNEKEIRFFLESQHLMTVPDELKHYRQRTMPDYLKPLSFMGVTDDLTSESRLDEDAYRYIEEPSTDLPYFARTMAMDPRPMIAHEGVPGHYLQLALSWANPNPIRRRFIDSGPNEGFGFYVEEMLLQAGLFSFSPRSREIIFSFMRLRALRVEVDIKLATGEFDIEAAGDYLAKTVPMDSETAYKEAVFFASNPGQAISYQIGKLQIEKFLTEASLAQGDEFSLRHFHDFLLRNGNVPISLLRWEYLDQDDEITRLKVLEAKPVTVPN